MKNYILKTYTRQRESDLITLGYRVIEKLENNANFPNLPDAFAKMKAILPEFQAALINAKGKEKEAISVKNDKKAQLLNYIDELARFVTAVSNGDRTLMLNSGFDVYGARTQQALPFIDKLDVVLGPPGEATVRVKRMAGIRAYLHQYLAEPPSSGSVWHSELSAQSAHTFKGLNSAAQYWFRSAAVHASKQTLYSPVVQRIIQ